MKIKLVVKRIPFVVVQDKYGIDYPFYITTETGENLYSPKVKEWCGNDVLYYDMNFEKIVDIVLSIQSIKIYHDDLYKKVVDDFGLIHIEFRKEIELNTDDAIKLTTLLYANRDEINADMPYYLPLLPYINETELQYLKYVLSSFINDKTKHKVLEEIISELNNTFYQLHKEGKDSDDKKAIIGKVVSEHYSS